jgi:hypothetical protein
MAAARVGVGALDYKRLRDQKLRTANDLTIMVEQFQEGRAFVFGRAPRLSFHTPLTLAYYAQVSLSKCRASR